MSSESEKNSVSNTSGTSSSQSSYAGQVSDLNSAFANAMAAYSKASGATAPSNFVASFDPSELAAFRSMIGYGNNNAVPNAQANNGTALSDAGTAGAKGALSGLGSFDPTAATNPSSVLDTAKAYMSGVDIPSMVAQAMHPAVETARDVTLPGIEQNAALTGNTNSTRTGIAEGLVQRGLAENTQNLTGSLESQAFQNALQLAQQKAESDNTSKVGALTAEGSLGNTSAGVGNTTQNSSVQNMIQQLTAAATGGAGLTAGDQATLDNALKQYQSSVTAPFAPLDELMQIIGNNYGQTTNSTGTNATNETTTTTPSPFQIAGGVLGAGTSLLGSGGLGVLAPAGQGILSWLKG